MNQTPVTFTTPGQPATYSWEATDEEVAARFGLDPESIVRFDLNTSPEPPGFVAELLSRGRFETTLSEYPSSDYRRLVTAAAATYDVEPAEILVGAGADVVKVGVGPGARGPDRADLDGVLRPAVAVQRHHPGTGVAGQDQPATAPRERCRVRHARLLQRGLAGDG